MGFGPWTSSGAVETFWEGSTKPLDELVLGHKDEEESRWIHKVPLQG